MCLQLPYKFSYKFAFIPFLFFRRNKKQESNFPEVVTLVMKNISVLCLQRVALYFEGTPNSIEFNLIIFSGYLIDIFI